MSHPIPPKERDLNPNRRRSTSTNDRRAPRADGRRTTPASIGSDRQRIKGMWRRTTGSTNFDFISEIYAFTGTIARLVSDGSLKADYGVKALEACREVSRHFFQGNTAPAWIELKNLIEAFGIATKAEMDQPKRTRTRKLFKALTGDKSRWPKWNSLSVEVLDFYAELGVELRPLRVQLNIVDGPSNDSKANAFQASLDAQLSAGQANEIEAVNPTLDGPQLGASMATATGTDCEIDATDAVEAAL